MEEIIVISTVMIAVMLTIGIMLEIGVNKAEKICNERNEEFLKMESCKAVCIDKEERTLRYYEMNTGICKK